ncbi:MAG: cyclic nucleotide-binding domain-containing protein [Magnetococcales bacterium]|nr:cyclic nucleotide-binding domain-containing protein [Magnetococcales bacterium]
MPGLRQIQQHDPEQLMREIEGLDINDLRSICNGIDFFACFSPEELDALIGKHLHVVAYEVGEYLIKEGSADERSLFFLLSGGASVVKRGARIPLVTLRPGDFFGEVSFLTDRVRTTNVIVHPPDMGGEGRRDDVPWRGVDQASTVVMRFAPALLTDLEIGLRIKFKDLIIQYLSARVDATHEQVVRFTGQDPMLTVDPELEQELREWNRSLEERERTKDRLIAQLAEFLDELNRCLVME